MRNKVDNVDGDVALDRPYIFPEVPSPYKSSKQRVRRIRLGLLGASVLLLLLLAITLGVLLTKGISKSPDQVTERTPFSKAPVDEGKTVNTHHPITSLDVSTSGETTTTKTSAPVLTGGPNTSTTASLRGVTMIMQAFYPRNIDGLFSCVGTALKPTETMVIEMQSDLTGNEVLFRGIPVNQLHFNSSDGLVNSVIVVGSSSVVVEFTIDNVTCNNQAQFTCSIEDKGKTVFTKSGRFDVFDHICARGEQFTEFPCDKHKFIICQNNTVHVVACQMPQTGGNMCWSQGKSTCVHC